MTKDLDLYQHSVSEICAMLDDTTFTISTVKQENLGVFLERFSQIPCRQWVNDPNPHLRGKVLLVTYQDGSREWICADGTFYWNTDSSKASITRHYFDKESFSNLLAVCQQLT